MVKGWKVYIDDVLKFETISQDELDNFCEVYYINTGIKAMIEPVNYEAADHTKKKPK